MIGFIVERNERIGIIPNMPFLTVSLGKTDYTKKVDNVSMDRFVDGLSNFCYLNG